VVYNLYRSIKETWYLTNRLPNTNCTPNINRSGGGLSGAVFGGVEGVGLKLFLSLECIEDDTRTVSVYLDCIFE